MNKFEKESQRLRKDILRVYAKPIEYNTDCDGLAADIVAKTQRRISASTLKRMFGFVKRTSNFSKHTFDTAARYVGFESWLDYINVGKQSLETPYSNELWTSISDGAYNISDHNLSNVVDCYGIDPDKVAMRKFAEKRLAEFLDSPKLATAFVAPGGYGKSVISSMLVNTFFFSEEKDNPYSNDIVWYVDGGLISNVVSSDRKFKTWLYEQMGYDMERDMLSVLHNNPQYRLGKLIIYIDGFNEINTSAEKLEQLIEMLFRSLSVIIGIEWFKIVIACRPRTWNNFVLKVGNNPSIKNSWYDTVFTEDFEESINVPLMDKNEINEVLGNHDGLDIDQLGYCNSNLANVIANPYMLELFLKTKNPLEINEVGLYLKYSEELIMKGECSEEKLAMLNELVTGSGLGLKGNQFDKKTNKELKEKYPTAYQFLLSYGVLYEYKVKDSYLTLNRYLKFFNEDFFTFLIANDWLRTHSISFELFEKVEKYYKGNDIKFGVMRWLILYVLHEKKEEIFEQLIPHIATKVSKDNALKFNPSANNYYQFIELINTELRKDLEYKKVVMNYAMASPLGRQYFIEAYNDIDALNLGHASRKDTIDHYLEGAKSNEELIFAHASKFTKYFLSCDEKRLVNEMDELVKADVADVSEAVLGMSFGNQLLYNHFILQKSNKQLEKIVFQSVESLAGSTEARNKFPHLMYFVVDAYNLCGKHSEAISLFDAIKSSYKNLKKYHSFSYNKMLNLYHAHALLHQKEAEDQAQAFEILKNFEENDLESLTPNAYYYWRLRYYMAKVDFLEKEGNFEDRSDIILRGLKLAEMLKFEQIRLVFRQLRKADRERMNIIDEVE